MATEDMNIQEPDDKPKNPVVTTTPPTSQEPEVPLTQEQIDAAEQVQQLQGDPDDPTLSEEIADEVAVDGGEDIQPPQDTGQLSPMTPQQKAAMDFDKLQMKAGEYAEDIADVITFVPESIVRGGLTMAESLTELVVNAPFIKPLINPVKSGELDKRIDLNYSEMFLPANQYREMGGDMATFMGFMALPIPLPGKAAAVTATVGKYTAPLKSFVEGNKLLKKAVDSGDKLGQAYFKISGGKTLSKKGMKAALLMPADFGTLTTNKDETVGEYEGRLKNLPDELLFSTVVGGTFLGLKYVKNVILPTAATQKKGLEMLEEGMANATTKEEIDAVATDTIEFVEKRMEEVQKNAAKQTEEELVEVAKRRGGAVDDKQVKFEVEPHKQTLKEFKSPSELPTASEGNRIVYHAVTDEANVDSMLKEGHLSSKKSPLGEGPRGVMFGSDSPTGYASNKTVIGFEVPEASIVSKEGHIQVSGDVPAENIVFVDRPATSSVSSEGTIRSERVGEYAETYHEQYVLDALERGETVSSEVIADYPRMASKYPGLVEPTDFDKLNAKELRQYVADKGLKSKARTADELRKRIREEEAALTLSEAEAAQKAIEDLIASKPIEEIQKGGVDLASVFQNNTETKKLARLIGVRVAKEGARGKHRNIGDIQLDIADFFQQALPQNTGPKPSRVPVNISTQSADRRVQSAWRSLPKAAKAAIDETDQTVKSHAEYQVDVDVAINDGNLIEDVGALKTLAERTKETLQGALRDWRILDGAIAGRMSKLTIELDAALAKAGSKEERIELAAKYAKEVDEVAEDMATWKEGQMDIARELGFMRTIKDGTEPVQVLTDFTKTPKEFQKFLEEAFPGQDVGEAAEHFLTLRKQIEQIARMGDSKLEQEAVLKGSGYSALGLKIISGQFINSMLASFKTAVVNIAAPAGMSTISTFESVVNSIGKAEGMEAWMRFTGHLRILSNIRHSGKMARQSLIKNDSILDSGHSSVSDFDSAGNSVVKQVMGRDPVNKTEKVLDLYNNAVSIPGRGLLASDEMWKNLIYRKELATEMRIQAYREAAERRAKGETISAADEQKLFNDKWKVATLTDLQYTRKNLMAVAEEKALEAGLKEGTKEYADFTGKFMLDNYDASIASAAKESLDQARRDTFTTPLDQEGRNFAVRGIGQAQDNFLMKHWLTGPLLRTQVPFIRVPTNILSWYVERQVAAPIRGMRDLGIGVRQGWRKLHSKIASDIDYVPRTAKEAAQQQKNMGKLVTGLGFSYHAYTLALSGTITGGGPEDPKARRAWEADGWRPYSIKVGDEWVSYLRSDPAAMFYGTMADAAEAIRYSEGSNAFSEAEIDDLLFAMAASVHEQLDDRTFLRGIQNIVTIVEGDDEIAIATALKNTIGNLVPYGNLTNSFRKAFGDDYVRNVNPDQDLVSFMVDAMKSKVPGLSSTLPPRMDYLGQYIESTSAWQGPDLLSPLAPAEEWLNIANPIMAAQVQNDPVYKEIIDQWNPYAGESTGFPLSLPQKKLNFEGVPINLLDYEYEHKNSKGEVEWTGNLWDRYQWATGHIELDGKILKEALAELITSDEYLGMPDYDPTFSSEESKMSLITDEISYYRQEALADIGDQMYANKDNPELRKLGLMIYLYEKGADEHVAGNTAEKLEVRSLMEGLFGSEEGAVKAAEYLREAGIDTSDIQ